MRIGGECKQGMNGSDDDGLEVVIDVSVAQRKGEMKPLPKGYYHEDKRSPDSPCCELLALPSRARARCLCCRAVVAVGAHKPGREGATRGL